MIFYVHIAKTAGSALNRYLAENYATGIDHCERYLSDGTALAELVRHADWMSGHVPLPQAFAAIGPLRSDIGYYTCVRRPVAQVRSHYNWLVEIFYKGRKFYDEHPKIIKDISSGIRETIKNPTPASVARDLRRFGGLFMNNQVRYFVGQEDFATVARDAHKASSLGEIPTATRYVEMFNAIGDSDEIESLFNHIYGEIRYTAGNRLKENVSRYHFDPGLFDTDEVRATLAVHNRLDEFLYDYVTQRMTNGLLVQAVRPVAGPGFASPRVG